MTERHKTGLQTATSRTPGFGCSISGVAKEAPQKKNSKIAKIAKGDFRESNVPGRRTFFGLRTHPLIVLSVCPCNLLRDARDTQLC